MRDFMALDYWGEIAMDHERTFAVLFPFLYGEECFG